MPKKKIEGTCSVGGCDRELDSKGMCGKHYRMFRLYGRTHKVWDLGKRKHPLYMTWAERKSDLCPEWIDFWGFVDFIKEKPEGLHRFLKLDANQPYGPENYEWVKCIERVPGEPAKEWNARRWEARTQKYPALNNSYKMYKALNLPIKEYNAIVEEMYKKQNNLCAICHKPETQKQRNKKTYRLGKEKIYRLSLDHCHKTNKIRELLCSRCNTCLGRMEESVPLLQSMIDYIFKHLE